MKNYRPVSRIIEPSTVIEGAGVKLRRSISPSRANPLDPFLLFDHFAFNDPLEGPIRGFPMHPTAVSKRSPTCSKARSTTATAWGMPG
jgi:redox-sensitive bicupin YhaK (pirin superfamily)